MSSDDEDFDLPRGHYTIVQDCQVKRDNFDEWERSSDNKGKGTPQQLKGTLSYINTIRGLPVRVLIDEGNRKSYMVGIVQGIERRQEEYAFGTRKTRTELLLQIPGEDGVRVMLHMVSNSAITQDEWDTWIHHKKINQSSSEFQRFLSTLNTTLEEGLKKLRYLIQNNYEKDYRYDANGSTFLLKHLVETKSGQAVQEIPEDLRCCKCDGLPIKPYRCPNEHILCEGCFFRYQSRKNRDGQAETRCRICKEHYPFQPAIRLWRDELKNLGWSAKCSKCNKTWELPMERGTPGNPDRPYLFHMHLSTCH